VAASSSDKHAGDEFSDRYTTIGDSTIGGPRAGQRRATAPTHAGVHAAVLPVLEDAIPRWRSGRALAEYQ
jgi:hypothetical protein